MPSTLEEIRNIYHKLNIIEGRINVGGGGGVGNHNILSAVHPDSVVGAAVAGDLIYANGTPKWTRFPIGVAARYLRSDGATPVWATLQLADLPLHAVEHEIGGGDLVDHDVLTNFVANEHIDHTAITLTAGEGLQGGGTIAANRTFDLDVNGLVEDAAGASGDFFVYYDTVAGDHKKIDWDDMPGGGGASPWTVDVNDIYWDGTGHVTIGAIAPDSKMTVAGFNIYTPATADTLHFAIQNADISHGYTAYADADTYFSIQKQSNFAGGAFLTGFASTAGWPGMRLMGLTEVAPTGTGSNSRACIEFVTAERSGTGGSLIEDADNLAVFYNWTTAVLFIMGDGSIISRDTGGSVQWFLADNSNAFQDTGLTINQRSHGNEILAFKSSDVSQGYTTNHEADTYAAFQKYIAAEGGLSIHGMSEVTVGIELKGGGDTDNMTKSAAGIAPIILNATKAAAGTWGSVGANGNLAAIRNNDSSVWIMDAEGDSWQNGTLHIDGMKSGANQGAAGAAANELWRDTADNSVKLGV